MSSSAAATTSAPIRGEPLAVELVNTVWADRDGVHDALSGTTAANGWVAAVRNRLPEVRALRSDERDRLTRAEAARLRRLRDAIRMLAAEVTGDPRAVAADPPSRTVITPREAIDTINTAAAAVSPVRLRRAQGLLVVERTAPTRFGAALGAFAADAAALLAGEHDAGPLGACLAPGCVLFFTRDQPRREWCSDACGNRARVARHYERARAAR
jgi:predicted RNA-binding Zn ribbon-like protein